MKTKLFFLLAIILLLWMVSCSKNDAVEANNDKSNAEVSIEGSEKESQFPDAFIVRELPRIDSGTLVAIEGHKIIRTQEELEEIFSMEALAVLPSFDSIDFSNETLLLGAENTHNHIIMLEHTYTKTGDSTYLYNVKASGTPSVYGNWLMYGIIVNKLPPTAVVEYSFEELAVQDTAIDKEETKKFLGTWKTDYTENYGNAVIVFKENGTIGLYSPLEEDTYYVYPNNILRIEEALSENSQLYFDYEFLSDTELMIYDFTNGINPNEGKNILFTRISDKEIDVEEATKEQFVGTWKTEYEMNHENNILVFKEDGTVALYEPFEGENYYIDPNNKIRINMFEGQSALSFKYAFISDTELMLYNFTTGYIELATIKNIPFTKIPDIVDNETKKFWGTWKTNTDIGNGSNIIVFTENGTIEQYQPFEFQKYYIHPNKMIRIDVPDEPVKQSFYYEFISETELIIYRFFMESGSPLILKDVLFTKQNN